MCQMASAYMFAIMWGLPATLGFVALKSLNEGSNMTRPAMYVGPVSYTHLDVYKRQVSEILICVFSDPNAVSFTVVRLTCGLSSYV